MSQNADSYQGSDARAAGIRAGDAALIASLGSVLGKKLQGRVNVMGTVVALNEDSSMQTAFVMDDGKDKIIVRNFRNGVLSGFNVGDSVVVIGRTGDFNDDAYIAADITRKIDPLWIKVRAKELEIGGKGIKDSAKSGAEASKEMLTNGDIVAAIRSLDIGNGVPLEGIMKLADKMKDARLRIDLMLKKGDIFEVSPGRLKVLE
ncbi:hypothetical protein HYX09_05870 [Candidatus Woesearchaeota archaeon]|nr:hypothetical protein [Candidatus Woesearchaeota archaeon]MBI2661761.1 hypothetical protein [Candidatus Woesearchaeota archaeon]